MARDEFTTANGVERRYVVVDDCCTSRGEVLPKMLYDGREAIDRHGPSHSISYTVRARQSGMPGLPMLTRNFGYINCGNTADDVASSKRQTIIWSRDMSRPSAVVLGGWVNRCLCTRRRPHSDAMSRPDQATGRPPLGSDGDCAANQDLPARAGRPGDHVDSRDEQRQRLLPARVVIHDTLCLYTSRPGGPVDTDRLLHSDNLHVAHR